MNNTELRTAPWGRRPSFNLLVELDFSPMKTRNVRFDSISETRFMVALHLITFAKLSKAELRSTRTTAAFNLTCRPASMFVVKANTWSQQLRRKGVKPT